jgi:hypothetical protein
MAHELERVGGDPSRLDANEGRLTAIHTLDGTVVLKLSLDRSCYGLTEVEGILATARMTGLGYVAWEVKQGDIAGTGRSYDPSLGERVFTVISDGQPVLTLDDLDAFEHVGSAEGLLRHMQGVLRLPSPERIGELDLGPIHILIEDANKARLENQGGE